jgi:threonine/homoserine/homoserine lactone efflux protein
VGDLLLSLIPYGIAAAIAAPAAAVVAALILGQARRPILGGTAFVSGAVILDAVFAAVILALMEASGQFTSGADIDGWIDTILGVIFIGIGVAAVFQTQSPEKEAAQRARIEKLTASRVGKLVVLGVVVQIINSDALAIMGGGLKEIAIADVTVGQEVLAVAWLMALVLLPYYVPVVMYAVSPRRSTVLLRRFSDWLLANARIVEMITGLVLGGIFLWKGLASLT